MITHSLVLNDVLLLYWFCYFLCLPTASQALRLTAPLRSLLTVPGLSCLFELVGGKNSGTTIIRISQTVNQLTEYELVYRLDIVKFNNFNYLVYSFAV